MKRPCVTFGPNATLMQALFSAYLDGLVAGAYVMVWIVGFLGAWGLPLALLWRLLLRQPPFVTIY